VDFNSQVLHFKIRKKVLVREKATLICSLTVVAVVLAGVGYWLIREIPADPRVSSQPKVSGKVDYVPGRKLPWLIFKQGRERKNLHPSRRGEGEKMVRFDYENNGTRFPSHYLPRPEGRHGGQHV
jgi:hypothetical protein